MVCKEAANQTFCIEKYKKRCAGTHTNTYERNYSRHIFTRVYNTTPILEGLKMFKASATFFFSNKYTSSDESSEMFATITYENQTILWVILTAEITKRNERILNYTIHDKKNINSCVAKGSTILPYSEKKFVHPLKICIEMNVNVLRSKMIIFANLIDKRQTKINILHYASSFTTVNLKTSFDQYQRKVNFLTSTSNQFIATYRIRIDKMNPKYNLAG